MYIKADNFDFLAWLIVIDYWFLKSVQNPGVDGAQSAEVVVMDGDILVRAACQIRWNKLQARVAELSKLWMSQHVFVPIFVLLNFPPFPMLTVNSALEFFFLSKDFILFPKLFFCGLWQCCPPQNLIPLCLSYKTFYMKPYPVGSEMYASGEQEFSKF